MCNHPFAQFPSFGCFFWKPQSLPFKGLPAHSKSRLSHTIRLNSPRRIIVRSVRRDNGAVFMYNININKSLPVEMHTEVSINNILRCLRCVYKYSRINKSWGVNRWNKMGKILVNVEAQWGVYGNSCMVLSTFGYIQIVFMLIVKTRQHPISGFSSSHILHDLLCSLFFVTPCLEYKLRVGRAPWQSFPLPSQRRACGTCRHTAGIY